MSGPADRKIEAPRVRERASLGMELPVQPLASRVRVLILQHPQEPDKELGSAALLARALESAELRVGLSWRNLKAAAGEGAIPSEWAVLYMGAKDAKATEPVSFLGPKGETMTPAGLKGLIVLDGTWSQAKTLWWRNPWLLKLRRIVLRPGRRSFYGRLRKEPRADALSTIESCALALERLDPAGPALREHLEAAFQGMLDEYRRRRASPRPAGP